MIWVLLTRLLYFLLLLWCKVLDAYYMMILGESLISLVDDCASKQKSEWYLRWNSTFCCQGQEACSPCCYTAWQGNTSASSSFLNPPPNKLSCKQGPTAKGLVQVLPDGFGLLMKIFLFRFFLQFYGILVQSASVHSLSGHIFKFSQHPRLPTSNCSLACIVYQNFNSLSLSRDFSSSFHFLDLFNVIAIYHWPFLWAIRFSAFLPALAQISSTLLHICRWSPSFSLCFLFAILDWQIRSWFLFKDQFCDCWLAEFFIVDWQSGAVSWSPESQSSAVPRVPGSRIDINIWVQICLSNVSRIYDSSPVTTE